MNILIVKISSFGDIVQSFDVLEYLKEKYPSSKIDWITSHKTKELVAAHPLINKVMPFDLKEDSLLKLIRFARNLRSTSYDIIFDLQANSKSGLVTLLAKGAHKVGFGPKSVAEWLNLLVTDFQYDISKKINVRLQYLKLAQLYLKDSKGFHPQKRLLKISESEKEQIFSILKTLKLKTKILVCPGAKWKNKELAPQVLSEFMTLIDKNLNVSFLLLWGNEHEKEIAEKLFCKFKNSSLLLDKLSIPMLQNLMGSLDLVIAMDSLPLHLAATVDVPTFSFFGPSSSAVYKPIGTKHFALQGQCPDDFSFAKRCPKLRSCLSALCIKELDPKKIFKIFTNWWESLK